MENLTKVQQKIVNDLIKRFKTYSNEDLQYFNGDNEETLKHYNREDAINAAVEISINEWYESEIEID